MSEYMPKVGDRVRATLGENVLIGEVAKVRYSQERPILAWVFPNPETFDRVELRVGTDGGWRFEQVVEVPTKIGAIIVRKKDGIVLACDGSSSWCHLDANDWYSTPLATDGGFTVLFEGVDE